mmetsp:Transcript_1458/g.2723  ORF Transcript_1458/g.2723 Transcript_1458/m.2723 type:complete len:94 (+) Transcript_1458:341-622(+)
MRRERTILDRRRCADDDEPLVGLREVLVEAVPVADDDDGDVDVDVDGPSQFCRASLRVAIADVRPRELQTPSKSGRRHRLLLDVTPRSERLLA